MKCNETEAMNKKGTEFTIFQGASSIHVDNNQQRIEEEEAIQDQIRRHAEVRILNKFMRIPNKNLVYFFNKR